MIEKRASLEVIAPSVDEAITKGLDDLGLRREDVDVEILDQGSRGLFGIGSRQARIRLTIKSVEPETESAPLSAPQSSAPQSSAPQSPASMIEAESGRSISPAQAETQVESEPPVRVEPGEKVQPDVARQDAARQEAARQDAAQQPQATQAAVGEQTAEDQEYILRVARETVSELLGKMKVRATVTTRMGEAEDAHSKAPLLVEVRGNDLSILIGPRAETLNALQYIAGLIVGKELGKSIPMVVDVEGYRTRREQQIRQLARRMADQAVKTGKRQVLEPMPANERRLIHIELRSNPNVETESIGEEPRRKVTIFPKPE